MIENSRHKRMNEALLMPVVKDGKTVSDFEFKGDHPT